MRSTSAGFSSIPTTCVVVDELEAARVEPRRAEDDRLDAVGARREGAFDHGLGAAVSSHRVDGNPAHGRRDLRSVGVKRFDLAALVMAAGRADAVRALRLVARRADVDLRRLDLVRRAPLVAT